MAFDTAALDVAAIGQGVTLLSGDCRTVLPTLAANSVQCCVTSPPYYGLRDYGTAQWDGGDAGCDHSGRKNSGDFEHRPGNGGETFRSGSRYINQGEATGRVCGKCGARRIDAQIGLEATPEAWIAEMVAVFREVKRVLRDDGTLWLNMGDSYASGEVGRHDHKQAAGICVGEAAAGRSFIGKGMGAREQRSLTTGLPAKNLLMMPARVALALQADGWWLRSQMPWIKRSCMPESTTDRPTNAIEYVYLFTKSPRYFYDSEAVKRGGAIPAGTLAAKGSPERAKHANGRPPEYAVYSGTRNFRNSDLFFDSLEPPHGMILSGGEPLALDVNPASFNESHFATFPPRLVEPLIRAGTSERGCCAACGAPWVRTTEKNLHPPPAGGTMNQKGPRFNLPRVVETTTTGWAPTCKCDAAVVPCTILDPFAGAGTALLVADRLQRNAIGIELNVNYTRMAMERCRADAPLFSSWPPAEDPADQRMAADAKQRDMFACAT